MVARTVASGKTAMFEDYLGLGKERLFLELL
jgi:hypothetical protein